MLKSLCAVLFLGAAMPSQAALRLPSIISDHMVLQQGKPARIWGWDKAGTAVKATLDGKSASATAGKDGRFQLELPTPKAGGPYQISIEGSETKNIQDVLVGEVWIGAGQSNMEFGMSRTHDAAKELPKASYPNIRLFTVDRRATVKPQDDAKGTWQICTPESAKDFSGVAYHFGKEIHLKLKQPVGMIASSWGGSPAEAWTPRAALDAVPELAARAKSMGSDPALAKGWEQGFNYSVEIRNFNVLNPDTKAMPGIASSQPDWMHSEKPGSLAELKASAKSAALNVRVDGGAWASLGLNLKGIDLSKAWLIEFEARGKGKVKALLHPKGAPDYDDFGSDFYSLGKDWQRIRVPLQSLKQGGWGIVRSNNDLSAVESVSFAFDIPYWPDMPELIYNSMLHPITPYAIQGALWYQGESNAGRHAEYQSLLSTMIQSWRSAFKLGDFPFYIVELPNWGPGGNDWVAMRKAQKTVAATVKNAGSVETMGLGDEKDIHPTNKSEVGKRLAKLAIKKTYNK